MNKEPYVNRYRAINVPLFKDRQSLFDILRATGIAIDAFAEDQMKRESTIVMYFTGHDSDKPTIGMYGDSLNPGGYVMVSKPSEFVAAVMEELASQPKTITVKLNDKYSAVVHRDKIVVGCQTFPTSIIYSLKEAHEKVIS